MQGQLPAPSDLQPGAPQAPLLHISSFRAKIFHILFSSFKWYRDWKPRVSGVLSLPEPTPALLLACCLSDTFTTI